VHELEILGMATTELLVLAGAVLLTIAFQFETAHLKKRLF
jgi:hypothetical protein